MSTQSFENLLYYQLRLCLYYYLRQLLQGSGLNLSLEASVNQYLQLTQSGNDAVLKIRVAGDGAFAQAVQTITMTNGWSSGGMNADLMALLSNQVILA